MEDKPNSLKELENRMRQAGSTGWSAMQKEELKQAQKSYSQALEIARQINDKSSEAVYLSYLGLAKLGLGKIDEGKDDLKKCVSLAEASNLHQVKAHALLLLGEQERISCNFSSAIEYFLQSLSKADAFQDKTIMEMAFGNLGLLYMEKGWAEQASECFKQALSLSKTSKNPLNESIWLGNLGNCLAELGQYNEAIDYYKQSFDHANISGDFLAQSLCLGSIGNCYFEQSKFKEAIDSYLKALEISKSLTKPEKTNIWLGNLGNAYRKLNETDKAINTINEALSIAKKLNDNHAIAAHLDSLGECYMDSGQIKEAEESYKQALELSKKIEDRIGQRIYLTNLGRMYKQKGDLDSAYAFYKNAIKLFDEQRSFIKSDDLKTSFAGRGYDLYRDMVTTCLSSGKRIEALEYAGQAKARAILDLLANSPIDISELKAGNNESLNNLIDKEIELREKITKLEQLYWNNPSSASDARTGKITSQVNMQKICNEWHDTINQLRRYHPNYANIIAVNALKFQDIISFWNSSNNNNALLSKNTAIIEYYWTDQFLFASAIHKDCTEPKLHHISDTKVLSSVTADLNDLIAMSATPGWEVPISLCKRLYDHLLASLIKDLPNYIDRLIFIPHNSLHRLPFAALNNGSNFLIEKFAISYLPTVSLIPILAKSDSKKNELTKYLVSAISDYSGSRHRNNGEINTGLEDLQHTLQEAECIIEIGKNYSSEAKLLTNGEVKNSFSSLFGQYPVIHFAGHAVFNPANPLASGLVLGDGSMLTASAILQSNVLKTNCGQLLILSACQTGTNAITQGGEIVGLTRALMYAGMPNLILSLWEVADLSTSNLMKDFHQTWQEEKISIAQSLRDAQKKAIQSKLPLHAWAPFFHLGIE